MTTYKGGGPNGLAPGDPTEKSALSSSTTSSSDSDDSGSSSDSDSSSTTNEKKHVGETVKEQMTQKSQFSVTSSDSAGLRMKIAIPKGNAQQPSNSREPNPSNNNNNEKKRLTTKKLIPQHFKPSNQDDKSGSDSDSSWCTNASRGGSTSSGDGTDSTDSDSSTDETLQEINPADLEAVLPSVSNSSGPVKPAAAKTPSTLTPDDNENNSSSDMELPNLVNDVIRRIERGSDTETSSTKAVQPSMTYTSSLLQEFVAKTQMITAAPTASTSTIVTVKTEQQPKKRGRPRTVHVQQPPPPQNGPQVLSSESPDSGILSTVSPAPSPASRIKDVVNGKRKTKDQPKYSLAALEKSAYATERILYPPRRKKPGRPPKEKKPPEDLDPLWKKIDLNNKFREPCLDGYKSDGGQSICCSKRLAAQSGYVSDYYGSSKGRLSGYKSDHSSKARYSGYRSDVSRAKSCGYRSDCSTRHRKKVRRKRRKKIGISSKSAVDELSDILQLSALTLGTNSSTSSSQESLPTEEPPASPPKKHEKIPLQTFNGLLNASKPKFGATTVNLGQASAFGKKLNIKQSPMKLPLSRANVQKNNEELSKKKSSNKEYLSFSSIVASKAASKPAKSVDGRSTKSRRTSRHDKPSSIRCRRASVMSRCSSRSTVSRHPLKQGRRRRSKSRNMSVSEKAKDAKLNEEVEHLSESLRALCRIYAEKEKAAGSSTPRSSGPAKRGPKKRKQSESATEPTKRRTKKTANTQSPDDHKLPLKKRHYLLTNGEKAERTDDEGGTKELQVDVDLPSGKHANGSVVSPKKRLLAEAKKSEVGRKKKLSPERKPGPGSPETKTVTKKLRSDPSNFKTATSNVPTEEKREPKKPGRKPKNALLGTKNNKESHNLPSNTRAAAVMSANQSSPPPGVFEPTVDLELQIPVTTISLPAIVQGKTDFSPPAGPRGVGRPPKNPTGERVVEKLLNKTGGSVLMRRKRRRANRTGFPSTKKPKKKRSGEFETDKGEQLSPCDRVPADGEPATVFVQRNQGRRRSKETPTRRNSATKPLQDANVEGKKDPGRQKRQRESTPVGKKTRKEPIESPTISRLKQPRDLSSDNEPLSSWVRTSDRIKGQEKNKENKTVSPAVTPEVKRRKVESLERTPKITAAEFADRLTVSIERIPGLRIPPPSASQKKTIVPALPLREDVRRSRLDQLTREFNQKFAVVKLKSLDDFYCGQSRSMIDVPVRRERSKSVGRGILGKSGGSPDRDSFRPMIQRMERAKSVAPKPQYVGVQPAEVLMKNILENRTRSRAKSVARTFSPERSPEPVPEERRKRAKTVSRTFSTDEDVALKKRKKLEKPEAPPLKVVKSTKPKEKVVEKTKKPKEEPEKPPVSPRPDLEDLIPSKKVARPRKKDVDASPERLEAIPHEDVSEHEPLPPSSLKKLKSPEASKNENRSRKKYLTAGLFSDHFKEDSKHKPPGSGGVTCEKVTLPPPPYCENYFRRTVRDFQLPFDIWQAYDSGKLNRSDTVPSWNFKKLRVNAYGDVKAAATAKTNEQQVCSCKAGYDCAENCLNRLVYTECTPEFCPCGDKCKNTKIQKHEWAPGLEKFMTESKGWGVRCKLPVRKGQFISEYLGEVVTESKFKERMQTAYINDTHHYCLNLDKGLVIDGHRMGSDCRFVNHSCAPNCEMQKWSVNGLPRMCLFALRDIEPFEELTYDYNFALYNPAEGQPCKCGAVNCRGVIGGKSQRVKNLDSDAAKRSRKKQNQAKKNQPVFPIKYGSLLPTFVPPTDHERAIISKYHCFLMRNLRKERRNTERPALQAPPPPPKSPTPSLTVPMAAVRAPRNMRTRGLAMFEDNPELEKSARVAVVLRGVCEEIEGYREKEEEPPLISRLALPSKKKCPLYFERIPCPVDLAQIEVNVEKGAYNIPKLFNDDMMRVFTNAITYYGIGSKEGVAATTLSAFYKTVKEKAREKLEVILGDKELVDAFMTDPKPPSPAGKWRNRKKKADVQEDIIRCICGLYKDEGTMIQCSKCTVWQHIECTHADPSVDNYLCEKCDKTKKVDYEITLNEFTEEGYQYYLSLMRGDLQIRQGDTVYVLRDIPMSPDKENPGGPVRKHNYQTIGSIDYSQCDIFRVESLWKDGEGKRFAYGHHYLRPRETYHEPTRKFYTNEILRSPLYEVVPIELIMGRCWVMDPATFCKGRPVDSSEPHVYICELRVDKSASTFAKNAKNHYPICTKSYAFYHFETKLKIMKTFAPHELGDIQLPRERKKYKHHVNKEDSHSTTRKATPVIQLIPMQPKTPAEKRSRLEDVLGRLMSNFIRLNQKALPADDASYLVTGRGARSRRPNAATPAPADSNKL